MMKSIASIAVATLALLACSRQNTTISPAAMSDPTSSANEIKARLGEDEGKFKTVTTMKKVVKTDEEWKKQLGEEVYKIARAKGTERAFCGLLTDQKEPGIYSCICCGLPLFSSDAKFHSGTGWPSFFQPVAPENVTMHEDLSYGMDRVEILCARCDCHLGHVFADGPKPTGQRHCVNSASLKFTPLKDWKPESPAAASTGVRLKAAFGAGCFWGVEDIFRITKGVTNTAVGYMGGTLKNPTYKDVCTNRTGHAEVVQVEYDPAVVSYDNLLEVFWANHDPTTMNRQGPDIGTQYRSAIFFYSPEQQATARESKEKAQANSKKPIVTEISLASEFYRAEEYHQQYLKKNGLSTCHTK